MKFHQVTAKVVQLFKYMSAKISKNSSRNKLNSTKIEASTKENEIQ